MAAQRKLVASEAAQIVEHLLRLDPEDRRLRFGGGSIKPEAIATYFHGIDWRRSWFVGYFDGGVLRGVAQIGLAKPGAGVWPQSVRPGAAEFAVSVEKAWQRRGVGTQLLSQAVVVARNRNIRNLYMLCVPENEPVRRLARKVGIRLVFRDGEVTGEVELPRPDQLTVLAEIAGEAAAAMAEWTEAVLAR
jgi:GNAT superfamily N-acetyltransferase